MRKHTWMTMAALGALTLGAFGCGMGSTKATPAPPVALSSTAEKPGEVVEENVVSVSAVVVKVDQKDRVVTLRNAKGEEFDVQVGEEVRNLPQVKKGDEVVVSYYESMALTLKKPGEATPGVAIEDAGGRAEVGKKPGAIAARQTTMVATVVGLDKKKGTVTLKGPRGKVVTVTAREPKRLQPVKVGDLIEAVYTEAVAISVEKPIK